MIPIKIQCGCGQRYAFDAEPVNGRLAAPVSCPACGVDGTAEADKIIAQSQPEEPVYILPAPPPPSPSPAPRMRLHVTVAATPAPPVLSPASHLPSSAPHASQLGLVDRDQAVIEARAKVSWGDSQEAVLKYLMIQGFKHEEAAELIAGLFKARALAVRGIGVKKILTGIGLMFVPVAGLIFFHVEFHVIPVKIMALLLAVGVWGFFRAINGAIMVAVPKMQSGDVAEQ